MSAIIYRNAYKPDISKLADVLHFKGMREKHRTGKAITSFLTAPFNWVYANLNSEEIISPTRVVNFQLAEPVRKY